MNLVIESQVTLTWVISVHSSSLYEHKLAGNLHYQNQAAEYFCHNEPTFFFFFFKAQQLQTFIKKFKSYSELVDENKVTSNTLLKVTEPFEAQWLLQWTAFHVIG